MEKLQALKTYFGHDAFRPGQEEMIDALLAGRDALGVMPTGAGKSMCYQIPALMKRGITLVISPLISLMKDQVAALKSAGIPAAYINSSLTPRQLELAMERAAALAYRIIYVAPERLEAPSFLTFVRNAPIALVAVDEAHCVSQWGQDFRPNYLKIADFLDALPQRPPVGAFTATATARVKDDIIRLLRLRGPVCVTTGFDRPNLFFEVERPKHKYTALEAILRGKQGQSGIVYCATRKTVEDVCNKLTMAGFSVSRYHAGLSDEERRANQEDFQYDRVAVMIATNAFGMGIDKSNVSFVIHYNMPRSMEAYYQEAGRAGRDGGDAECILFYSGQDIITGRWMIEHAEPNPELTAQEQASIRRQDFQRLQQMISYCNHSTCLRGSILRYFGQQATERCGNCSLCAGGRYGFVNDLARPSRSRKAIPTVIPAEKGTQVSAYEDGDILMPLKPGVRLGHREEDASAPASASTAASAPAAAPTSSTVAPAASDELFEQLRTCRMALAKQLGVPPYIVAADKTLTDMARKRPRNRDQMLQVYGMGTAKVGRYGDAFIQVILAWEAQHGGTGRKKVSMVVEKTAPAQSRASRVSAAVQSPVYATQSKKWNREEDERLRRGYLAGVNIAQLAAIHGRTEDAIRKRLMHLHLIFNQAIVDSYGVSTDDPDDE